MAAAKADYKLAAEWVRELRSRGIASHEACQTAEAGFAYLFGETTPAFNAALFAEACRAAGPQPPDEERASRESVARYNVEHCGGKLPPEVDEGTVTFAGNRGAHVRK